jgi:predicted amidophosphoribosyltransferase
VRKRGRRFISEVSRDASLKFELPIHDLLLHTRTVKDQSGLHLQERWNNLEGALVVSGRQRADGKALLIDDLVTTGATLSEAARALRYAGIEVIGAVTAAIAQPLRYRDEMG